MRKRLTRSVHATAPASQRLHYCACIAAPASQRLHHSACPPPPLPCISDSHCASELSSPTLSSTASSATPIYDTMLAKLAMLQPTTLVLEDVSHEHAGHSGAKGLSGESHFDLDITANCFDGLASVKRHQLVYTILGDTMQEIHALQIKASTPE